MDKIYAIEGMVVSFRSYEEAELFRRYYNRTHPNDYYEPRAIKTYNVFDRCADALKWGGESAEDIARQRIREEFEESVANGWIYG